MKKSSRREVMLLICAVVALAAAVIWIRTATVRETYEYVQQEKELRRLEEGIQSVKVKWVRVTAPGRLESLANSLGLAAPRLDQVVSYGTLRSNSK
jgi:hypothetical protein